MPGPGRRRRKIRVKVILRKHNGKKEFIFRWRDPHNGKPRQRLATDGDGNPIDGTEAKRRLVERMAGELEQQLVDERHAAPWPAFCQRYSREKLKSLAPKSGKLWTTVQNQIGQILDPKVIQDLDADSLGHFSTKLREIGLREATIATYLRTIRAALGWAKKQGILAAVPAIEMPARAAGVTKFMRGRPLVGEEVDRLVAACVRVRPHDYKRWRRLIRGLDASGLRLGEALSLSWDRSQPVAVILDGGLPVFRFYAEGQKGHRDELLPMAPEFATLLRKVPEARRTGLVFKNGLSSSRVSRIIKKISRSANVKVADDGKSFATAHDLRRTFGTRWASKLEPAELQRLMRHKSIETTLKFYVRIGTDVLAQKLWDRVGGNLGTQPEKKKLPKNAKDEA